MSNLGVFDFCELPIAFEFKMENEIYQQLHFTF